MTIEAEPPAALADGRSDRRVHARAGDPGPRRRPSISGNTAWSLSAEGTRLICGLGVFIILANRYEPDLFGPLVATIGLFQFVLPQSSLGAGWLLMKRVSGQGWDPEPAMARAIGAVLAGGVVMLVLLLALRPVLLPQVSVAVFVALGVIELLFGGVTETALFAAQAMENLRVKAATMAVYGLTRLLAATALLLFTERPPLELWVVLLAGASLVVSIFASVAALGRVVVPVVPSWTDIRQGLPFSIGFGADRLRESADSVMLVRADLAADSGLYAAARRLLNVFNVPIVALTHASNARFFEAGGRSRRAAGKLAVRLVVPAVAYGFVVGALLWWLSEPLSQLLPGSYAETSVVIGLACLFPLLYGAEIFPANALTGSGLHHRRIALNILSGAINVGLNLIWIPDHGWRGAVAATIVSSAVSIVTLWAAIGWAAHREATGGAEAPPHGAAHVGEAVS